MARQLRIEYDGAFYHITARGNERKEIYSRDEDRKRFLEDLERIHNRFKIKVHAYCLMSNHYHILMETPLGNLSRAMQNLNTGYTVYYNQRNKRSGHLFQGRYKAILVEKDQYLLELSRYIHINPVRAKIVKDPEDYQWSSCKYFYGKNKTPDFLDIKTTLAHFGQRREYQRFVEEVIEKEGADFKKQVISGCFLGGEEFVEEIKAKYLESEKRHEDLPGLKQLKQIRINESRIIETIQLSERFSEKEKRKLIIYFLRKFTDKTLREVVGEYFRGESISGVNKVVKRLERRMEKEVYFSEMVKKLEGEMSKVKV